MQERILREAASVEARMRIAVKARSFLTLDGDDEKCERPSGEGYPAIPRTHPRYPNVSDALEMKYEVGNGIAYCRVAHVLGYTQFFL